MVLLNTNRTVLCLYTVYWKTPYPIKICNEQYSRKLFTFGNLHDCNTCNMFVRKSSTLSMVMCITMSSPTPTVKVNSSANRAASLLNNPAETDTNV